MTASEVLAPAGSMQTLCAAVYCGADAVYLGMGDFNARRGAKNFTPEQLAEAVKLCHVWGVKVYVTLNTLVRNDELERLSRTVGEICAAGVDAVLVQDLAVWAMVRTCAPQLALHASTQMSVHESTWLRTLAGMGFSRVVLARECSKDEIRRLTDQAAQLGVETEVFVHGAHCMSVSGQCYMSAALGSRSGNRGMCAQPCRLPFFAKDTQNALSLRDMSLVEHLRELQSMGVASLKIEGRMKRPEYVAAAVSTCRAALDGGRIDESLLRAAFSRNGFTDGYYTRQTGRSMFGTRTHADVLESAGAQKELASLYENPRNYVQRVPVDFALGLFSDSRAVLVARDSDCHAISVYGDVPQQAKSQPTSAARARAALEKTGGTPYRLNELEFDNEQNLMLPVSAINSMRREALAGLDGVRGRIRPIAVDSGLMGELVKTGKLSSLCESILKNSRICGNGEAAGIYHVAGGFAGSEETGRVQGERANALHASAGSDNGGAEGKGGAAAQTAAREDYSGGQSGITQKREASPGCSGGMENAGLTSKVCTGVPPRVDEGNGARRGELFVRLSGVWQLTRDIFQKADIVILPHNAIQPLMRLNGEYDAGKLCAGLMRADFSDGKLLTRKLKELRSLGVKHVMTATGAFLSECADMGFIVHAGATCNIFNLPSAQAYMALGAADCVASWELDLESAAKIAKSVPTGVVAYGHLPLMCMRNCPVRAFEGCERCRIGNGYLTDRTGRRFFTGCAYGMAELYNPVPLYIGDKPDSISSFDFLELRFTRETPDECEKIVGAFFGGSGAWTPGEFTRGLYYKKVI